MTGLGGVAASDLACGSRRRFPASSAVFLPPFFSLSAFTFFLSRLRFPFVGFHLVFVRLHLLAAVPCRPSFFYPLSLLLVRLRFLFVRLHFVFVCFHLVVVLLELLALAVFAFRGRLGLVVFLRGVASGWSNPIPEDGQPTHNRHNSPHGPIP